MVGWVKDAVCACVCVCVCWVWTCTHTHTHSLSPSCMLLSCFTSLCAVLLQVGQSAGVPVEKIFMSLTATVVVPLVLGQLVRYKAWGTIKTFNIPFSQISSSVLLLIIYATFCQTFKGVCVHVCVHVCVCVCVRACVCVCACFSGLCTEP